MPAAVGKIYLSGDVEIDTGRVVVRRAGEERSLRPKTFHVLIYLLEHRDRLVPKEELIEQLWPGVAVSDGALAQCISDIRRALDEDARNPKFIRTAARLGYQFIAPLDQKRAESVLVEEITEERVEYSEEVTEEDEPPMPDIYAVPLLPAARLRDRRRFGIPILIAGLAIAAAVGGLRLWPRPSPGTMDTGIRTAIFAFENRSGRPDMEWLRVGLSDMLATSLSQSPRIALITPQQLERGIAQSSSAAIRYEDALRAARKAGAGAMIMGAFACLGETVRLDTQIYDVPTGRLLGGESLTVHKPELLLTQVDSLSSKLAARLGAPSVAQTRLAEVMTNNLEAYRFYSLGLTRTRNLRLPEAIASYEQAVKLDPSFAMAYARIGFTYSSTWAKPEVGKPYLENAYRLSDRLTPRDRMFIRAWYAVACRDYEVAEQRYKEILSAYPLEIEAYHALGTLLNGDGRYAEARQILERGLTIEPDMPQLYNTLSNTYLGLGETEKAVDGARRYISLSGEPNAYDTLAGHYQTVGRYDEAREAYLEAIRRKPDFEIAIVHLGNLYFQLGQYRKALEQYREYMRLAATNDERARGHDNSAWLYWRKGDFSNAEREAAEAARLNGQSGIEALFIAADRGALPLTEDLRRRILGQSSLSGRGTRENYKVRFFAAGYVALRDHKTEEALHYFRAAVAEPRITWYIEPLETCLADALLELGRFDEAIAEYQRVLKLNPNYPMARYRLGLALEQKGMNNAARAEFEGFLTVWKDADADIPELIDARRRLYRSSRFNPGQS